jgi:hypothetical protein
MTMNKSSVGIFPAVALLLAGCVGAPGSQEDREGEVGTAPSELLGTNALNMNALNMNALNMNALNMNALNMNALSPTNLAAIQSPTATGDLARQLLKYTVSCALDATQSFSFSWTDASGVVHNETDWGLLGLAQHWDTNPLSSTDAEWVSACLLSRTNWYGTSVSISARGPTSTLKTYDPGELTTHTQQEGVFWGNLFATNPVAYSCDYAPNAAHSRSLYRDCATGHLDANNHLVDCGMLHRVGSCASYCDPINSAGTYYPKCEDSAGVESKIVLTIFLQ